MHSYLWSEGSAAGSRKNCLQADAPCVGMETPTTWQLQNLGTTRPMLAMAPPGMFQMALAAALVLLASAHGSHKACSHSHSPAADEHLSDHSEHSPEQGLGFSDGHSHDHHGHSHSHDAGSCSHDGHGHHSAVHDHSSRASNQRVLLPEELAEEEDLKLYGLGQDQHINEGGLSTLELWIYAMGCSLLVSMASLICLVLLPLIVSRGKPSASVVDVLAAFGGGAMMGDAFLHQLPHAFGKPGGHEHSHSHVHEHERAHGHAHTIEDLSVGLSVLTGIILFFVVEKIVRYVEEHGVHTGHHHHHHNSKPKKDAKRVEKKMNGMDGKDSKKKTESLKEGNGKDSTMSTDLHASTLVLGYLNLFSDGVHNFTDGMALGAAFLLHGTKGGWYRTLFLLVHELPQEVGDFGILVRSGFSVFKALAFNFLSALVALAGTAIALLFGADPGHSSLIEGFTAGGFLYISLAGVLPEMHKQGSSLKSTLVQLFALSCGIGIAVAISLAE